MPPDLQRRPNICLNNRSFNINQFNTATRWKTKQCRIRWRTTHHHTWITESRRKNLDLRENHLFGLK